MLKFSDRVGGFAREENCVGKIDARKRKRQNAKYKYFGLCEFSLGWKDDS